MTSGTLVGVDVGGTKVLAAAISDGRIVAEHQVSSHGTADDVVAAIVSCVGVVAPGGTIAGVAVEAIGLGIPGYLGLDGVARRSPNLGSVVGVDIGAMVGDRLGLRTMVNNDANCAAWAAYRRDAPEADSVVAITLGTGIGGGIVIDGALVRGARGFAGEPGHMIVDPDGPQCACGQHGCWEVWASGTGLARLARVAAVAGEVPGLVAACGSVSGLTGRRVFELADDAGHAAEAGLILDRFAMWIARGVVNLVNLLDPDCIIFSGGVVAEGDQLLGRVRDAVDAHPSMHASGPVDLRISGVGPSAGALGAALLAEEQVRRQ